MNLLQTLLANVTKRGPYLTITGAALAIVAVAMKWKGHIESSTMLEMIGTGVVLAFLPDPKKKDK
jgi:predicted membrane protein